MQIKVYHQRLNILRRQTMAKSIFHPAPYVDVQIRPAIQNNNLNAEVVWTYLVARKYENDHQALVDKLSTALAKSRIWIRF